MYGRSRIDVKVEPSSTWYVRTHVKQRKSTLTEIPMAIQLRLKQVVGRPLPSFQNYHSLEHNHYLSF